MDDMKGKLTQELMFSPTPQEWADRATLTDLVHRATCLLRDNEPEEGYYLAFSGGKDSVACKALLEMSGCKYDGWYNNTTIDPPELVRFIKKEHADIQWNNPEMNMMTAVATKLKVLPTRRGRWCCDLYKEQGGKGRVLVMGVRQAESRARKTRWREVTEHSRGDVVICPIVHWVDAQLWDFIKTYNIRYCSLYNEGFTRLGCVGCPLTSKQQKEKEFSRWPRYKNNWMRACKRNWELNKGTPRKRDGKPRYQAKFKKWEDYWDWWMEEYTPDIIRGDCQTESMWTNEVG